MSSTYTSVQQTHSVTSLPGGASDPGERLGVHVEQEARLHPHLPLQPGHRAQGRGPRQTAPAGQGNAAAGTHNELILQEITGGYRVSHVVRTKAESLSHNTEDEKWTSSRISLLISLTVFPCFITLVHHVGLKL